MLWNLSSRTETSPSRNNVPIDHYERDVNPTMCLILLHHVLNVRLDVQFLHTWISRNCNACDPVLIRGFGDHAIYGDFIVDLLMDMSVVHSARVADIRQ